MTKKTNRSKAAVTAQPKAKVKTKQDYGRLTKLSLYFFDRPRFTALLFLVIFLFGVLSYTTLLKREGFPAINIPVSTVSGGYFVNDPAKVDQEVAKPIAQAALTVDGVKTVSSQSFDNFYNVFIQYEDDIDAQAASDQIEKVVNDQNVLPNQATADFAVFSFGVTGAAQDPIDIAIAFYGEENQTTAEIAANAEQFATALKDKNLSLVADVVVQSPFTEAVDPVSGQAAVIQQTFDRFGIAQEGSNNFFNSVIIGVKQVEGADLLDLDDQVRSAVAELSGEPQFAGYSAEIAASFAPDIRYNISELQRELLIAFAAILIVGSLVIALRASLITVIAMLTVILTVISILYLFGYTLNVITLFALILSLALIVDDTIIMVEAIDTQRRRQKDPRKAVGEATHKISRAMISATFTAALSFAPLLFVGGILGSFIQAMPVTVISALLVSLVVALVFIPFFSRFILLRSNQMGEDGVKEIAAGVEHAIARFIARPMIWAKGSMKRLTGVGMVAIFVGFTFIAAGGFIATKVSFNIFPPSKDANDMQVAISYQPGTTLQQAQVIADKADTITAEVVGENFEQASYYGLANERDANLQVRLISYNKRDVRAPQIIEQLQAELDSQITTADVKVSQIDAGPPAQAFTVAVESEDRDKAFALAADIAQFMENDMELVRPSGEEAQVVNVNQANPGVVTRADGNQQVTVSAEFDGTDTSTLFLIAQAQIEEEYTAEKLAEFGLPPEALQFALGQESENQESFAALAVAFPLVLLAIYVLLAFQFKSLLQPVLILLAIPFSLFGISLSLYLTDNPLSFFAMLGFFALIGLSIKNTILLTDYANQAKRAGLGSVDAIVEGLGERFRPLIATSLTAVAALIPLSIISPFWQGLAVLIIFGLLSSTFLVITVFPYYYLGAELVRRKISRKVGISITVAVIALFYGLSLIVA